MQVVNDLREVINKEVEEIAYIYSLNKDDVYYYLLEVIAEIEKANYAVFYGKGIKLIYPNKEKYLSFSKKRNKRIISLLRKKVLEQSFYNMKLFVKNLIINKTILFASIISENNYYYLCEIYLEKNKKINWLKVFIKKEFVLSNKIKYFPIKLKSFKGREKNQFYAKGVVFDKDLIDFHFEYFIKPKFKIVGDFDFKTIKVFKKDSVTHILVRANRVIVPVLKEYIKNYFKTFGAIIKIFY